MRLWIELAEKGLVPDRLIREGIRFLDRRRLAWEDPGGVASERERGRRFIQSLRQSPIALDIEKPKEQHYELPPSFFQMVLGGRMKYSACYWPSRVYTLDEAEEAMLDLTCRRAQLEDGMEVLDLGCGWGSLSLWVAEKYPKSKVLAITKRRRRPGLQIWMPVGKRSSLSWLIPTEKDSPPDGYNGGAFFSWPAPSSGGSAEARSGSFPITAFVNDKKFISRAARARAGTGAL